MNTLRLGPVLPEMNALLPSLPLGMSRGAPCLRDVPSMLLACEADFSASLATCLAELHHRLVSMHSSSISKALDQVCQQNSAPGVRLAAAERELALESTLVLPSGQSRDLSRSGDEGDVGHEVQ